MYAQERHQAMAQLVGQQGRVSVVELAAQFDVTTETVRRDLSALERTGLVRRVHGGAVPSSSIAVIESGLYDRDRSNPSAKEAIATAALGQLPPTGGVIVIDAGTTTARLASTLPREHRLTVVTHAVTVAARLAGLPNIELHLLPGRVRPTTHAAVGSDTVAKLEGLHADVAFVATNGLTPRFGLSTPDADEAATKRAIVASADRRVVLCDSSKIGVETTVRFARLDDIDVLITDDGIDSVSRRAIEAADVEVVIA